ncbi:UNKNOWN [Stylonychia lemnae]|uniref:Uncharacterized protein n=1 Tax=Stylonychia lemnae TaxID=5949 RepID=A0A077ZPH4_STYLE|nr:UNKNOWN [Stylonychia lemnae]|eukprot:CDW71803.1 UNKNOWN [Stylonychia lemnae]
MNGSKELFRNLKIENRKENQKVQRLQIQWHHILERHYLHSLINICIQMRIKRWRKKEIWIRWTAKYTILENVYQIQKSWKDESSPINLRLEDSMKKAFNNRAETIGIMGQIKIEALEKPGIMKQEQQTTKNIINPSNYNNFMNAILSETEFNQNFLAPIQDKLKRNLITDLRRTVSKRKMYEEKIQQYSMRKQQSNREEVVKTDQTVQLSVQYQEQTINQFDRRNTWQKRKMRSHHLLKSRAQFIPQNLSPSVMYQDIVDGLSDVKKPSVPDFGFQFYENSFIQQSFTPKNYETDENTKYWKEFFKFAVKTKKYERLQNFIEYRHEQKQQVEKEKHKKKHRKSGKRRIRQAVTGYLAQVTYNEIMKDQGIKLVKKRESGLIKFENIQENKRSSATTSNGTVKKVNFQEDQSKQQEQVLPQQQQQPNAVENKSSKKISQVLPQNQALSPQQKQTSFTNITQTHQQPQKTVIQNLTEIKRLIMHQAIYQQMQAQQLNIQDLKSNLKNIKDMAKKNKKEINLIRYKNQNLVPSRKRPQTANKTQPVSPKVYENLIISPKESQVETTFQTYRSNRGAFLSPDQKMQTGRFDDKPSGYFDLLLNKDKASSQIISQPTLKKFSSEQSKLNMDIQKVITNESQIQLNNQKIIKIDPTIVINKKKRQGSRRNLQVQSSAIQSRANLNSQVKFKQSQQVISPPNKSQVKQKVQLKAKVQNEQPSIIKKGRRIVKLKEILLEQMDESIVPLCQQLDFKVENRLNNDTSVSF